MISGILIISKKDLMQKKINTSKNIYVQRRHRDRRLA